MKSHSIHKLFTHPFFIAYVPQTRLSSNGLAELYEREKRGDGGLKIRKGLYSLFAILIILAGIIIVPLPIERAEAAYKRNVYVTVRLVNLANHAHPTGTWWSYADAGRDAFEYWEDEFPTRVSFVVTMKWTAADTYDFDTWDDFEDFCWEYRWGGTDSEGRFAQSTLFVVSSPNYNSDWAGICFGKFKDYAFTAAIDSQTNSGGSHSTIAFQRYVSEHEIAHGMDVANSWPQLHCLNQYTFHDIWPINWQCKNRKTFPYSWYSDSTYPMACCHDLCYMCYNDLYNKLYDDPFYY
jgi:hypothetical protein